MGMMPKLRIRFIWSHVPEEFQDIEQAKDVLKFNDNYLVTVNNEVVNSFEELGCLVDEASRKNKKYIDIVLVSLHQGG